jgi:hypothetical protein
VSVDVAGVLARPVSLGAAIASGGEFIDDEIIMLDGIRWDPARFIELAGLAAGAGGFAERCERFLRQFPQLEGWPAARSAAGA